MAAIDQHHLAISGDLSRQTVLHQEGRRLIDADTEHLGILQDQAEEAVLALPLQEVLVDDGARQEAEAFPSLDLGCRR